MFLAGPGRHSVYEAMVSRPCRADDGSRIAAADARMLFSRRVSFRREIMKVAGAKRDLMRGLDGRSTAGQHSGACR